MNRSVFAGLLVAAVVLLTVIGSIGTLVVAGYGTPTGADGNGPPSDARMATAPTSVQQQFDSTFFEITVHENGSATWTFRHERTLETEDGGDDIEAFEAFAEEFESEETDLYQRFTRQAEGLTETGEERTDREMEATAFNRSAYVEHQLRDVGVVEMTFRWDGFADVDDDGAVVVGDVFDGLFLQSDQHLIVEPGESLVFVTAQPDGEYTAGTVEDANSITWRGEQEFIDGQPRVVLENEESVEDEEGGLSIGSPWFIGATLLVVSLAIAGVFAWRRTERRPGDVIGSIAGSGGADENAAEPSDDPLAGEELLTDEDRVVKLIRENGGRMKQVDIVEETGWSKSKVSMLLSEMESEGAISKLRVGRENIISLDGFEPEATKSPFDE